MKNIKFVIGFSVFGFLLSFIFGLFSHSGFFHILLIAFVFALVFAGLAAGLQILFDKVLDMGSAEDSLGSSPASQNSSGMGQNVNIVIEDQDIPEDESDSQFFVGTNHQMLNESDYNDGEKKSEAPDSYLKDAVQVAEKPIFTAGEVTSASSENSSKESSFQPSMPEALTVQQKIASENSSSSGFVPISLGETPKNISGTESKKSGEVKDSPLTSISSTAPSQSSSSDTSVDELDVLPDMEEIAGGAKKEASEPDGVEEDDSYVPSGQTKDVSEVTEGKDVALMAKAISTLLTQDK